MRYGHPMTSFNGVLNWLREKYPELYSDKDEFSKMVALTGRYMKQYFINNNLNHSIKNNDYAIDNNAKRIQKNFPKFVKWCLENKDQLINARIEFMNRKVSK